MYDVPICIEELNLFGILRVKAESEEEVEKLVVNWIRDREKEVKVKFIPERI